ncbi:acyl-CoA thioesterase [Paracoccus stylophorae]|uniref:Acyl-CoA thioesterase n=1 Tax=Paracoccus stylophorae TaxID=659350 RepID=A0ABY7STH7_9RHOB|nr:acyl-CoA thioesterase [Paracoccus stylophorae]WCR10352.1 acyl-CoA thioesterase [Paracoccus stylophorae]
MESSDRTPQDGAGRDGQPPDRSPTIRTIAMPADTNPAGDIFGGWLMSQMDLAAGTVAALTSHGRSATIAVEGMKFLRPVKVGDEVSLFADLVRLGRSSMQIRVQAWRRQREHAGSEKVTEAVFTFVALDAEGRARPVRQPTAAPG